MAELHLDQRPLEAPVQLDLQVACILLDIPVEMAEPVEDNFLMGMQGIGAVEDTHKGVLDQMLFPIVQVQFLAGHLLAAASSKEHFVP